MVTFAKSVQTTTENPACPGCGGNLTRDGDDAVCHRCGGLWLALASCQRLARGTFPAARWRQLGPAHRACLPHHARHPTGRCPVGGEPLEGGSAWGHPVDVCAHHGTFVAAATRLHLGRHAHDDDADVEELVAAIRRPAPYDRVNPWFRGGSPITGVVHAVLMLVLATVLAPSLLPEPRWPVRLFGALFGTLTLALAIRHYRSRRDHASSRR